jgi:hypothetical protein
MSVDFSVVLAQPGLIAAIVLGLEQLDEAAPHFKDEFKLIAMSKIGRAQMEQFMVEERQRKDSRATSESWTGEAGGKD